LQRPFIATLPLLLFPSFFGPDELLPGMEQFSVDGLSAFEQEWNALDALRGRTVTVTGAAGRNSGTALGIGRNGGLLVASKTGDGDRQVEETLAGDVSVHRS
jgi:biotin-(acetyl-CoA carboxylase) ligase